MFKLTKSQKDIQKAAREFAKGEFEKELAQEMEKNGVFPEKIWKKAAELGFLGIHIPDKYSGGSMGIFENGLVAEEFAQKDSTIACAIMLSGFASESILAFGSNDMKDIYLPKICEGQILCSALFDEYENNFDNIETKAYEKNGNFVINGTKTYAVNGMLADLYIVLCNTGDEKNNLSMILVESNRDGIVKKDSGHKLGMNMCSLADISFNNVTVPVSNLIGKMGNGYKQMIYFLSQARILLAFLSSGIAMGAFDRCLKYVKSREQFGRQLINFQITQHKIADMVSKIQYSRLLNYDSAIKFDRSGADIKQASIAKLVSSQIAVEVSDEAIQLFGGYGYMTEYDVERYYRDAKHLEIFCGNKHLLKDTIGQTFIK